MFNHIVLRNAYSRFLLIHVLTSQLFTLLFPLERAICAFHVPASGLDHFQLFVAVQNSLCCCLILQTGVLPYCFNV